MKAGWILQFHSLDVYFPIHNKAEFSLCCFGFQITWALEFIYQMIDGSDNKDNWCLGPSLERDPLIVYITYASP
jgi:hypothetical protein